MTRHLTTFDFAEAARKSKNDFNGLNFAGIARGIIYTIPACWNLELLKNHHQSREKM
jgi:hypothetical protein